MRRDDCPECYREWLRDPDAFEQRLYEFVDAERSRPVNRAKRLYHRLCRFFRG
jgi:hypothetical protein